MSWRSTLPLLCLSVLAVAGPVAAQQDSEDESQASSASAELTEALVEYRRASQPGAEHRWLEPLAGEWTVEVGWTGPDGSPRTVVGTAEHRFVLGGRFLRCEASVGDGEIPIEAVAFYGFDTNERRFFALRLDNLGTDFMELRGTYDVAARSFLLKGKERDEISGLSATFRLRVHVPGEDRHTMELFVDHPGRGPLKILGATYTRRQAPGDPDP